MSSNAWPPLPLADWADTYATLHLWLQIVGKVQLKQSPWINHSWHVTLHPTATGLTTRPLAHGDRTFQVAFDFHAHRLTIATGDGASGGLALEPQSVATFHRRVLGELDRLGLPVRIHGRPNEIPDAIPFAEDETHRSYDRDAVERFWQATSSSAHVLTKFRARFIGKCSPVHVFWGSPDLAVTRFSGRTAPRHPGGIPNLPDWVTREAYSHEVSSCGFWPGGGSVQNAAFYAYAYPQPAGFEDARVRPSDAAWNKDLREFLLPYDAVRLARDPEAPLMEFLQSTYEAAADLAQWDRAALERTEPLPRA